MKNIRLAEKRALLKDLANTWCKIAPSKIQGVGVFAIRNIPKGTHPFAIGQDDWIDVDKKELKNIPKEVRSLIDTYCLSIKNKYTLPHYGFKIWDMVVFLNHSKHPNVISIDDGNDFETIKPIKMGDELLIDYNTLDDSVENYMN